MGNIKKQTEYWKMASGQQIRICDMEDSHLINCLNLIRRRAIEQFLLYQYDNIKKITIEDIKEGFHDFLEKHYIYEKLIIDCQRRGLNWDVNSFLLDPKIQILITQLQSNTEVPFVSWGVSVDKKSKNTRNKVNNKFGLLHFENIEPKDEEELEF